MSCKRVYNMFFGTKPWKLGTDCVNCQITCAFSTSFPCFGRPRGETAQSLWGAGVWNEAGLQCTANKFWNLSLSTICNIIWYHVYILLTNIIPICIVIVYAISIFSMLKYIYIYIPRAASTLKMEGYFLWSWFQRLHVEKPGSYLQILMDSCVHIWSWCCSLFIMPLFVFAAAWIYILEVDFIAETVSWSRPGSGVWNLMCFWDHS